MKKIKCDIRKVISILLTLVMVMGMLSSTPLMASAADGASTATTFSLYVNGTQVTGGDGSTEGYTLNDSTAGWSYDPAIGTLTLTNATLTNGGGPYGAAIYWEGGDLTLELVGTNTLDVDWEYPIFYKADTNDRTFTIKGSGSLIVDGGIYNEYSMGEGKINIIGTTLTTTEISGLGDVTITDSTVIADGAGWAGIYSEANVTITNSYVVAKSSDGSGIQVNGNLTITDSQIEIIGSRGDIANGNSENFSDSIVKTSDDTTVNGTVTLKKELTIASGEIINFDEGASIINTELLTVADDATVKENGTVHSHNTDGEVTYESVDATNHNKKVACNDCPVGYVAVTIEMHSTTVEGDKAATCQTQAYCSVCGEGYGTLDTSNHTSETYTNGFRDCCGAYEPAAMVALDEWTYVAQIENAGQLFWYAKNCTEGTLDGNGDGYGDNVGAVLMNDIDLNPGYTFYDDGTYTVDETVENYSPTLREWSPIKNFAWVDFDGQGFTVSGLYINLPNTNYVGMFATNDYYTIKNITLTNGYVRGGDNTAALVGYNTGSVINCHSDISVVGNGTIGGLIAYHGGGEISYCSNSGSVIIYGSSSATGGIVGNAYGGSTISNCYNTGYIKGGIKVGGILGDGSDAIIQNCYNTGIILSNFSDAHGISGYGTIENCYTLSTEDDGAQRKTKAQFSSGEVTYLLQANQPFNEIYDEEWNVIGTEQAKVWYQTIGTDLYPTFDNTSLMVYKNQIGGCCEENYVYGYANTEKDPVTTHIYNENGECACGDLNYFVIGKLSSQIRFGENEDGSYAHTFDIRTRAKILDEDFQRFVGETNEIAVKNIKKVGFVYSINPESFVIDDAKAVAKGSEITGYTDAPVNYIQDADGYYMFTCTVINIPDSATTQTLVSFAYICVEIDGVEKWYFMDSQAEADFDSLYTTYIPMACESYGWEVLGEPTYTWADDYSTCTASKTCTTCGKVVATETVNSVYDAIEGTYAATFTNSDFEPQVYYTPSYAFDEATNTYTVTRGEGLKTVADKVNAGEANVNIVLANDIDLSKYTNWEPIGNKTNAFSGSFDGNGYTINNLTINDTENADNRKKAWGLFGYVDGTANTVTIQNVCVNGTITVSGAGEKDTGDYANQDGIGGIAGRVTGNVSFIGCHNNATVTAANSQHFYLGIGGILGFGYDGTVNFIGCINTGKIADTSVVQSSVGGIMGVQSSVGGIMGGAENSIDENFYACCNKAEVIGNYCPSAFLSDPGGNITTTFSNCYYEKVNGLPENVINGETTFDGCTEITDGDWSAAMSAMNEYLTTNYADYKLSYVANTGDNADLIPLVLKKVQ